MDDEEYPITRLADAAAAGDEQAWHEIVDRFAPLLACVIGGFRLTDAGCRDVARVVWLHLADRLGGLREPTALASWIITTCRWEAGRREAGRREAGTGEAGRRETQSGEAQRHAVLLAGMAELPPAQRELLLLMMMADPPLPDAQTSRHTGIAVADLGPARARALERIRRTAARLDGEVAPAQGAGPAWPGLRPQPSCGRCADSVAARSTSMSSAVAGGSGGSP